jgi:hypothetical protein
MSDEIERMGLPIEHYQGSLRGILLLAIASGIARNDKTHLVI